MKYKKQIQNKNSGINDLYMYMYIQTYDFSFYTTYFYHIIWFLNRTDMIGIKVTEMNCI